MRTRLLDEIQTGLEQKRANLMNWVETTPEEKRDIQLGPEDETAVEEHLQVSGDYFDFMNFKDGAHGIVMADVSGHGVSAGMLMSSLQTAFQTLVPESDSPLDVLERLNRFYMHNINFTTFVTIFFGKFD